jgi:beta-lactamase superfamily II metal-dependent hydrolase
MLKVHFFNVGHGDSILLEFANPDPKFILVDSKRIKKSGIEVNPAFDFLKKRGVKRLEAIVVTHLHFDHYLGIEDFIKNFEIGKLVVPPFYHVESKNVKKDIFDKLRKKLEDVADKTDSKEIENRLKSLGHILSFILKNEDKVETANGKEEILRFPNIPELDCRVYLPLTKMKGVLYQKIKDEKFNYDIWPEMNDMSLAISVEYLGYKTLLSGDATKRQFQDHQRQMATAGVKNLATDVLKVSHHGSRENCSEEIFSYVFRNNGRDKYSIVSANGRSHPHKEYFDLVAKGNLIPFCTNLHESCAPNNAVAFKNLSGLPTAARAMLIQYASGEPVECQGDITVVIDSHGLKVLNSTNRPCIYRSLP